MYSAWRPAGRPRLPWSARRSLCMRWREPRGVTPSCRTVPTPTCAPVTLASERPRVHYPKGSRLSARLRAARSTHENICQLIHRRVPDLRVRLRRQHSARRQPGRHQARFGSRPVQGRLDSAVQRPGLTADLSKADVYRELHSQLTALLAGERDALANFANMSALLYEALPDLNWAGFYFLRGPELVLGPFQGRVACVRIALGSGVCGTAAARRETVIVPDVHAFPGHIACDAASRSEIVVPLIHHDRLIGVMDLDSPTTARFDDVDARGLEAVAAILLNGSDVP